MQDAAGSPDEPGHPPLAVRQVPVDDGLDKLAASIDRQMRQAGLG